MKSVNKFSRPSPRSIDAIHGPEHGLEPDEELLAAVESLSETRRTHSVPEALPVPPVSWQTAYEQFSTEVAPNASTLDVAHERLTEFWAPPSGRH